MSIADELQFALDWEADRMGAVSAGAFKAQIAAVRDLEFQQAVLTRQNHGEAAARDQLQRTNLAAMADQIDRLHDLLRQIGDRAHDASTGPAVPDALWEIRGLAYDGIGA